MAEQLGEAVLTVRADTQQLEAGLQRVRQQAEQTGQAAQQAFRGDNATGAIRSIAALEGRLQSLRNQYNGVEIGSREFRKLQAEIQRTERELQKVDKTLGATFAQRAGGFGSNLLSALGIGVGVSAGAVVGGFIKGSIDQAVELENITRKLQNTLGPQGANAALNFTKGLSRDLGLNFKTLADSFGGFTAAATAANVPLETQKGLFAAVSRAGQALGLSNDAIDGSFLALQQVASKGTVAMEELRGQLGERLPIALSATAKGLGISQQELIKLVESGKLTAGQFFPALTKGLNELTAGAGGLETASQKFAKFQNAWEQLQASFGQNLLPGVTATVEQLTKAVEGLGAVNSAKDLGFAGFNLQKAFQSSVLGGPLGFVAGGFAGIDTQAAQATGALNAAAERYNLSQQQAKNIFSQAVKASGGRQGVLGLEFTDQQFVKLLDEIDIKAKQFRQTNRDITAEQQAQAAAAAQQLEADKAKTVEAQKQFDKRLQSDLSGLDLQGAQDRLNAARQIVGLSEEGQAALQGQLEINSKIRAVEADRLQLKRELDKPVGSGDGANGSQNASKIAELKQRIAVGNIEIETAKVERQNSINQILQSKAKSIASEAQTARKSLEDGARNAAKSLQDAAKSLDGTLRSGFQYLTPQLQQEQLTKARAAIQPLVDSGVIRTGIDISTPDKLFQLASFAESLAPAQQALQQAVERNISATEALTGKDWNVHVQVPGQQSTIPLSPV